MNNTLKELEYIKNQLVWIKTKIELDNQLGLYDVNKIYEDIFMHILNDVYDLKLKNANLLQKNFPAIDLVDDVNKIVIQVTSTTKPSKVRETIKKFNNLKKYSKYKLKIFYIKNKPNFQKDTLEEFAQYGITENDMLGIENIINIVQSNLEKCNRLYKTIQQRMDSISFKFNIDSYFEQFEPHLIETLTNKFEQYKTVFKNFINSDKKILEIHAVGGNGKSHLLKYISNIETEYIPLIFTKQVNEEDLKKIDPMKKYLFIFDDIDRFFNQLDKLLSYVINNPNTKLVISYRTASKSIIKSTYRKFNNNTSQEIEIIWEKDEIKSLIKLLIPNISKEEIERIGYVFNNNPYLIIQAINGNIKTIKDFSAKIIDDAKIALKDFNLSDKDVKDLLFNLSLLTPLPQDIINEEYEEYKSIISNLVNKKILREISHNYRFNPDIIGDLYLANYIEENIDDFENIIEKNLKIFSDKVFTNLSYALAYTQNNSLQEFIKKIIKNWINNKNFSAENLYLIEKIVYFTPLESFIYLEKATKNLTPKQTNALYDIKISLDIIEPIISKLIYLLKNNLPTNRLEVKIEHIINYLTSNEVMNLPKPYYNNHTIESIFEKLVSPLNTKNFDVIFTSLNLMEDWLDENPLNDRKIQLLFYSINTLLSSTFTNTFYNGINLVIEGEILNIHNSQIVNLIQKTKNILLKILECKNTNIVLQALDIVTQIGNGMLKEKLDDYSKLFYSNLRREVLTKCREILQIHTDFSIHSKIEDIAIWILQFSFEDEEALSILKNIDRNDRYNFYRIVQGKDLIFLNYEECEKEYLENKDNIENGKFYRRKIFEVRDEKYQIKQEITGKKNLIINRIAFNFKNVEEIIELLNKLDFDNKFVLKDIFLSWVKGNNKFFIEMTKYHLDKIENENIKNIIKEILYEEGLEKIDINNITLNISNNELEIYINSIFKNFSLKKINILNKIIEVISAKEKENIEKFIFKISQNLYFTIQQEPELYKQLEHIILQLLQWQLQYSFNIESYIINVLQIVGRENFSDEIRKILDSLIRNPTTNIDKYDLNSIYKLLGYGIEEITEILYQKLISKREDGTFRYRFNHFTDTSNIIETQLIKNYIKTYDDFKFLVDKALQYCSNPIEIVQDEHGKRDELKINLDYFFKNSIKKEYVKQLFNELLEKNDIEKIKVLYKIVPITMEYIDIIVQILNILDGIVSEEDLMNYLREVGKVKVYSKSHMQNSELLLKEEQLFKKIYERVDSLSLKLQLKEKLEDIETRKKQEIEEDISYLLKR